MFKKKCKLDFLKHMLPFNEDCDFKDSKRHGT